MGFKEGDGPGQAYDRKARAQGSLVGIVLLFALVMIGATLVFVAGSAMFDSLQSQAHAEKTEQTMRQFDSEITTIGMTSDTTGLIQIGDQLSSEIATDGELTVTVSNGYVSRKSNPIELQTLVATDSGGNEFAYQAGGIWRLNGDRATVVSDPNIRYYTESVNGETFGRVDISPTTVEGSVGTGEHTIRQLDSTRFDSFSNDIKYVNYVKVEVSDTSYHHAWYDFLKDEFTATDERNIPSKDCTNPGTVDENIICHDKGKNTVTVVASVNGETPLADLVDIEPTVYGGLYLDGTTDDFGSDITVEGYDEHNVGTNASKELFLANYDTFDFHNHADIDGVPVINGELGSKGNPEISPLGYGLTVDPGPNGKKFDEENDAYWLDAHKKALATELSSPYSDIDNIDDEIDELQAKYFSSTPKAGGTVTAGRYDGAGSIGTLNSSEGNVHVSVDGTLDLTNVEVKGDNRTSIYVDGDVSLSDVEIKPDDRANALWIYATSDSVITINDDFQGVIYAPGADIEIDSGTTVDGAIVAGNNAGIEDNVQINFDRSLRTDSPLSEADEEQLFNYSDARAPIDATFVLDRSGSMGPHNPAGYTYTPTTTVEIDDSNWEPIPVNVPFRNEQTQRDIEVRNTTSGETKRLGHRDSANPDNWHEIRVIGEDCYPIIGCYDHAELGQYNHPGNDPSGERVEATKNFVSLMNGTNGDRVGVYDFNSNGNALYPLGSDLKSAKKSVVANAYGGTNMAAGVREALQDYEENGNTGQERVMVLLSDGKNSREGYNDNMDALVNESKRLNVTLYTVGLTGPQNSPIPERKLERWANETGGKFYKAESASDLNDLFIDEIAKSEVRVDENVQVGVSVTNKRKTTSGYAVSVTQQTIEIDN